MHPFLKPGYVTLSVLFCALSLVEARGEQPAAGAGTSPKKAPISIEVATLGADEADTFLVGEIESFRKSHPDIRLTYYAIGCPRRLDVPLHTMTHIGQNVIGVSGEPGSEIYWLTSRDLIVPIDSFLPDPDFPADLFYENLWDAVSYKGKKWGVPLLCNAYALFCDDSLFKAAGIESPPKTWAEFLEDAKRLTKDTNGDGKPDQFGANIGYDSKYDDYATMLWKTMVLQEGGSFIKDGRFYLRDPILRRAYDLVNTIRTSGFVAEDTGRFSGMVSEPRRFGMFVQPAYRLKDIKGKGDLRLAPLPTLGRDVALGEKRYYLAIRKSTPEKEAASWAFVKWICRGDGNLERELPSRFTFPCRKDLVQRPEVQAQFANYPANSEFVHTGKAWTVQCFSLETDTPKPREHFDKIVADMFAGRLSFDQAMSKAEAECNEILRAGEGEVQPYALYK